MAKRFLVMIFYLLVGCTPVNHTVVIPAVTPTMQELQPSTSTIQELPSPTPAVIVTPESDALDRWGNKNTAVTVNRLGTGTVYAMALSPDGKTIAVTGLVSASTYDFNSLQMIWSSPLKKTEPAISKGIGEIKWSPDGGRFATRSEIGIMVWDARTGEQLQTYEGDQYTSIASILWTRDGRLAALDYFYGRVALRDIQTEEELFRFEGLEGPAIMDLLQGRDILAVASGYCKIIVRNTRTGKDLYSSLDVCEGYSLYSLKLSQDGTRLATASTDIRDNIIVWDIKTGEQIFAAKAPENHAEPRLRWSPEGDFLAVAFNDGTIHIRDGQTGNLLHTLKVDKIMDLAWSPDGSNLVSLSQYESIIVWDVKTGQKLRSLDEHTAWILSLAWSPDGSILASGSEDGEIILWDASSAKRLRSFHEPRGWADNLTWSPDGKQLASGAHNRITVWDVQTGEQLRAWSVDTLTLTSLAWSPDGSRLASLSYDGTGLIWDASSGKQLQSLPANRLSEALAWSPGGELLGSSYHIDEPYRQQVTLWDPQTGEAVRSRLGMYKSAWSPPRNIVASISDQGTSYLRDDTTLILWDPQTGTEFRRFNTGIFLTNVGWSPDGDFLILGSDENASLIVLDAQTGEELHRLEGHYDFVSEAAWSPRGDRIASASYDGTVILWEIDRH